MGKEFLMRVYNILAVAFGYTSGHCQKFSIRGLFYMYNIPPALTIINVLFIFYYTDTVIFFANMTVHTGVIVQIVTPVCNYSPSMLRKE